MAEPKRGNVTVATVSGFTDKQEKRGGEEDFLQCQLKVKPMELERAELCATDSEGADLESEGEVNMM